jgi:small subunit ribosomal protein S6
MRTFEVLFIISPQLTEEQVTNLVTEFRSIAEQNGATIVSEDAWGRRRLAYPISKSNEGIYHLFVLESENEPSELDRRMKNSDQVMRHMIVRTDLEQRRAVKLAKKNPPKQRLTPAQREEAATAAAAPASGESEPASAAAPPASSEPAAAASEPPAAESAAVESAPAESAATEPDAAEEAPAESAPAEEKPTAEAPAS